MSISLEFLTNIIVLLAQLYLGLIVIFHNPKSWSNRFFLVLIFFIAFQGVIQSFVVSTNETGNFDTTSRLSVFTVPAQLLFLLLFLINFPKDEAIIKSHQLFLLYGLTFVLMFLIATPLVFKEFAIQNGVAKPVQGPLFPLFAGSLALLVLGNVTTIFIRYFKIAKEYKKQILIIGTGIAISFISLLLTQFILPTFFSNAIFLKFISLFTLPMLFAMGYAIIGYRIFDVRVVPAELFTLLIWVLFLITLFFRPTETPVGQIAIFSLIILLGIFLTKNITAEVKQRDQLQKLSQQKSEFLSFASHQVKNPMSGVKGFAQLIADGTYGAVPQEVKEKAQHIKVIADRTIALVNNFLDFNKIEEGKTMDLKLEDVDIVPFIGGMVEEQRVVAKEKNKDIEIRFEHTEPSLIVKIDQEKMRQVIQNVIDNAVKYTEHGYIHVSVEAQISKSKTQSDQENVILIKIEDTGRGLSKELMAKLFGRYVRDEQTKNEVQGTGLGLYIAKSIVEAHHGTIWAESEGASFDTAQDKKGKGSRFFVQIPK